MLLDFWPSLTSTNTHYFIIQWTPIGTKTRCMTLSLVLFLVGILGFVLNRKNIILMLISIEMMLLAVTLLVIVSSFSFDDIVGQTYSIYIIAIAGAESAIGLGILVAFYRLIPLLVLVLLCIDTE
jgi:NADH-ubiquinone oxidoreductase chain 4L